MKIYFILLLLITILFLFIKLINNISYRKNKNLTIIDCLFNAIFSKQIIMLFLCSILIWILFSLIPYLLIENDLILISFYEKNIETYDNYIDEYTKAAQKQISEYQENLSKISKTAGPIQLQYYNQQIDAIGQEITKKIKEFNDLKLEEKIKINKSIAKIAIRQKNKYFF